MGRRERLIQQMREAHVKGARAHRTFVERATDAFISARTFDPSTTLKDIVKVAHDRHLEVSFTVLPGCPHKAWKALNEDFKQCTRCKLLMASKLGKKPTLEKLLPFLKDKIMPPTDKHGHYYSEVIVNDKLKIRRSLLDREWGIASFTLYVRFPKGWLWTMCFTEFQFDTIMRAVDPLLKSDPVAVYRAAQTAIYGRCWESNAELEKLSR